MTADLRRTVQGVDLPELDEDTQRAFFDQALQCAIVAEARAGALLQDIEIAGVCIRLSFAGPRLMTEFLPALGHLMVPRRDHPDAILHIWDSRSTGVEMVRPPSAMNAFTSRGDIWGMTSKRFRSAFHWSEYSVCVLDSESGIGAYWVDTAEALPYWAKSSPMRTMFHWLLEPRGKFLLHAAVVGDAEQGVLITGKGGVGKSTSSLMALSAGMQFVGDDYVVVSLDTEPTAYALYSTAKVGFEQMKAMPDLRSLVDPAQPPDDEKAVLYLHPSRDHQIARSMPLRWMVTPRFGDAAETGFEPVSLTALHQAASFTTMSQLPHAGKATNAFIGALTQRLKTASIVLGHDRAGVARALARLLTESPELPAPDAKPVRPLISVVTPVYENSAFLAIAVHSILRQDYPAIEIIIVDDGSSEDVAAAAEALPIDVRYLRQDNAGPSSARNRGIRDTAGDLIAFLDVDDIWPERSLDALIEAMDAGTDVVIGRGQLARTTAEDPARCDFVGNPEESFPFYIGAGLFRRSSFQRIGLFDEDLRFGEDADWYRRAHEQGLTVKRLEQVTLIVRRHAGNMTSGKTVVELSPLQAFKKALDRRRAR